MAEKYDVPILYSCHPRSKKRLESTGFKLDKRVIQHEPLGFHDYNCLQMNAMAVVSDSGTLPEESSFYIGRDILFLLFVFVLRLKDLRLSIRLALLFRVLMKRLASSS